MQACTNCTKCTNCIKRTETGVQLRFAFSDRVGRKSEKTVVVVVKFFIVVVVAVVVTLYTHGQAS